MFIAHAPAAWLLARSVDRRPYVLLAAVVGGVLPDVDMLYWLLDGRRTHHHAYFTHWPATWLALLLVGLGVGVLASRRKGGPAAAAHVAIALAGGALVHCVLDSVAGDVRWLAPLDQQAFSLVVVPATQPHWILSFVLHWTFGVELAICAAALFVWRKSRFRRARRTLDSSSD